jgi:uncharacterized protein YecT (DUF1311 family)
MFRIATASVVLALALALPQMALSEDVVATPTDEEIATQDAATVKACLDFVDAKREQEWKNVLRQKEAEKAAPGNVAPDVAKGEQKTGPEAYLEAVALDKPKFAAENCIGIVADACLETDTGGTIGMMVCYSRESEVWDARLNASYREKTAASSKKVDDLTKAPDEAEAKHLRGVQTAWIPWRDATCEVLYANGAPLYGEDAKIEGVYCDMVLTARQALSLEGKMIMSFDTPSGQ